MASLAWGIAIPALLCLSLVAVNALTWTRGRRLAPRRSRRVSVLIPARNEEANLEACVRHALASEPGPLEVLVYDDESSDRTPALLSRLSREDARVRALPSRPLPPGWVGKPHACQRLGEAARGDLLLFLDADVRLRERGLGRLLGLVEAARADVVTAAPRQETGSFAERLVVPLLHVTYMCWLPLALIPRTRDPRVLVANGQVLALTRAAWRRLHGFETIKSAIVDDMALGRRAKERGLTVLFADGHEIARCRMYRSGREVWEGFSKNLYLGLGARPARLALVAALYGAAFVLPYVALALAPLVPALLWPAVVGVAANVALRGVLVVRQRHPVEGIFLQPLAVLGLLVIAFNSFRWTRAQKVRWRGRTYAAGEASA